MGVEKMLFIGDADNDQVIDFGRVSASGKEFAALKGCVRGLHDLRGKRDVGSNEQVIPGCSPHC